MSFVYLPERVAVQSQVDGSSDGAPSATSSSIDIASKSCKPESRTDYSTTPQSGMMCEHSTGDRGVDVWILSLRASRASRFQSPANEREPTTNATCGPIQSESYVRYDRNTHSWRTSQVCLFQDTLARFSETWPKAGTILDGAAYQRQKWEHRIAEIGCGLWPTPISRDCQFRHLRMNYKRPAPHSIGNLSEYMAMRGLKITISFFEMMMGVPRSWTDLEPLAMDRFRKWLKKHGSC